MRLGYVIIYVSDVNATLDFYQAAFGFDVRLRYEQDGQVDYGELETGDAILGFASYELGQSNLKGPFKSNALSEPPFGQELAFVTEDVAGAYQRSLQAGAVSMAEPTQKPWGQTVAYVRAKEGTLIELCSPMG